VQRIEAGFGLLIFLITNVIDSNLVVYGLIASTAMLVKVYCIRAFSTRAWMAVAVTGFYCVRFLPLHELTQIRSAVAIACLLLALLFYTKERGVLAVCLSVTAVLFHYSALFVVPFLPIRSRHRLQVAAIAVTGFAVVAAMLGGAIDFLSDRLPVLAMYQEQGFGGDPNPISATILLDLSMLAVAFTLWRDLTPLMKRVVALQLFGFAAFYGSVGYAVFAHRIREMFSVLWVVFLAQTPATRPALRIAAAAFAFLSVVAYTYIYFLNPEEQFFFPHL
jgi:hypothetical protein